MFRQNQAAPLGFGLMRLPKHPDGSIDQEQVNRMVELYMAQPGPHHFDTAFMYDGGASEAAFKTAVADRYPRESYTVATKLVAWMAVRDEAEAKAEIDISLQRTGVEYFDLYLLHAVRLDNVQKYDDYHIWDYMEELKQAGKIRRWGMSYHATPELLDMLLTIHPGIENVQLQINYADWESIEVKARANYEVARKHNVTVTVMSPARGGALSAPPAAVRSVFDTAVSDTPYIAWALQYATSLEGVDFVLTGASSESQLRENLELTKERRPLDSNEQQIVQAAMQAFSDIPHVLCTMCHACDKVCPKQIAIPEIFSAMNEVCLFDALESAQGLYGRVTAGKGKGTADLCLRCGLCEAVCPEHIEIPEWLNRASRVFD